MSRREGTWGEALVANYLRDRGRKLISAGYQCRFGEIDLIALDGETLCFVEVKTRSNLDMALPREYVTPGKQSRIKKTALYYLQQHPEYADSFCRFDVAEVYDENGHESARVEYWENAFQ